MCACCFQVWNTLQWLLLIAYGCQPGTISCHVSPGFILPLGSDSSVSFWYSCSFPTLVWTRYYFALHSFLGLMQGRCKVERFPADCSFILVAYLTHCKWREWNMCLGGCCDGCDPAGCWLSLIAPRCVVTFSCSAPTRPHTIHDPVSDFSPLIFSS